jgi:hypothetical protein
LFGTADGAGKSEVRNWALSAGFELGGDSTIPEQAITAYNQTPRPTVLTRFRGSGL